MNDQLLNFSFPNAPVRGSIVYVGSAFQDLVAQRGNQSPYPLLVKNTLAEMATILLLMASNLKLQGTMSLQVRGSGHLYSLFTEVQFKHDSSPLDIRGIARRQEAPQPTSLDLRDWIGENASLAITLTPDQGKSYQSVITIEHPTLTQCIEDYYIRSEQIPTQFWTQTCDTGCAAIMVQHLPSNTQKQPQNPIEDLQIIDMEVVQSLVNTLRPHELLETPVDVMLLRLFHEFPVMKHTHRQVHYRCSCSSDRMSQVLISLGADDIKAMAIENPIISMNCQFCGNVHQFAAKTLLQTIIDEAT